MKKSYYNTIYYYQLCHFDNFELSLYLFYLFRIWKYSGVISTIHLNSKRVLPIISNRVNIFVQRQEQRRYHTIIHSYDSTLCTLFALTFINYLRIYTYLYYYIIIKIIWIRVSSVKCLTRVTALVYTYHTIFSHEYNDVTQ